MAVDTGVPFADGDDPDDAYDAADPIAECLLVIGRRIAFVRDRQEDGDLGRRLEQITDDVHEQITRLLEVIDALIGDMM